MKKGISLLCLAVFSLGCKDAANGLQKTVSVAEFRYTVQYRPAAYILERENLPAEAEVERAGQLEGMAWFNIAIRVEDYPQSPLRYKAGGIDEYGRRLDYYLNGAVKDIRLVYGRDTLRPAAYWFENNYNLTAHETLIAGFALPGGETAPSRDMQLVFHDQVFGNGIIKTIIKKEALKGLAAFKPKRISN